MSIRRTDAAIKAVIRRAIEREWPEISAALLADTLALLDAGNAPVQPYIVTALIRDAVDHALKEAAAAHLAGELAPRVKALAIAKTERSITRKEERAAKGQPALDEGTLFDEPVGILRS